VYVEHPNFSPPVSDVRIWRYVTLAKLLVLLERRELFFAPLGTLEDPLEGYFSAATVEELRRVPDQHPEHERARWRGIIDHNLAVLRQAREYVMVNCWHMNQHESAAMWHVYAAGGEGIAIQSTFERLKNAFAGTSQEVFIGQVRYIDFDTGKMGTVNVFEPVLCKRKSFEHEREIRAAFVLAEGTPYVPVELEVLIERLYVAPTAAGWFLDLVRRLVKRYDLSIPVEQSAMLAKPLY
jgi:hypothetical protein